MGIFPSKIRSIVKRYWEQIPKGKVLDLGCSDGAQSIFLAEQGYSVLSVDVSQQALDALAHQKGKLDITPLCSGADDLRIDVELQGVVATNVLNFCRDPVKVIQHLQEKTALGGVHIVSAFLKEGDMHKDLYFFEISDLKALYSHWDIVELGERNSQLHKKGPQGETLHHQQGFLIAKKIQ